MPFTAWCANGRSGLPPRAAPLKVTPSRPCRIRCPPRPTPCRRRAWIFAAWINGDCASVAGARSRKSWNGRAPARRGGAKFWATSPCATLRITRGRSLAIGRVDPIQSPEKPRPDELVGSLAVGDGAGLLQRRVDDALRNRYQFAAARLGAHLDRARRLEQVHHLKGFRHAAPAGEQTVIAQHEIAAFTKVCDQAGFLVVAQGDTLIIVIGHVLQHENRLLRKGQHTPLLRRDGDAVESVRVQYAPDVMARGVDGAVNGESRGVDRP